VCAGIPPAQVALEGAAEVEVAGDLQVAAAPTVERAGERLADLLGELLDELPDHLLHELTRHGQHRRVHQVLGAEHGLEQRRRRLDACEDLGARNHLVDAIAERGVALEALDRLLGEETLDLADPVGHRERGGAEPTGAPLTVIAAVTSHLAIGGAGLAAVEPLERGVHRAGITLEPATRAIGGLAEHEAPADERRERARRLHAGTSRRSMASRASSSP
jgi:hypothetical protein